MSFNQEKHPLQNRDSVAPIAAFPDFRSLDVDIGSVRFRGVVGGTGPALLLLHGFPETHLAWRHIAPQLARHFTVVAPDLPGYGDSPIGDTRARWTKRRVAEALTTLMLQLGHARFAVVGHDRGARAGYRLALDHPDHVSRYASIAVIPTLDAVAAMDAAFALNNFHWLFLAQPGDLPERLLEAQPDAFIDTILGKMMGGIDQMERGALSAYRQAFRRPAVRHAMCEDYRAAMHEDRDHDAVDRDTGKRIHCPVLVIWPEGTAPDDPHAADIVVLGTREKDSLPGAPLAVWRQWAPLVTGVAVRGGHLLPETHPQAVIAALLPFLTASGSATSSYPARPSP